MKATKAARIFSGDEKNQMKQFIREIGEDVAYHKDGNLTAGRFPDQYGLIAKMSPATFQQCAEQVLPEIREVWRQDNNKLLARK